MVALWMLHHKYPILYQPTMALHRIGAKRSLTTLILIPLLQSHFLSLVSLSSVSIAFSLPLSPTTRRALSPAFSSKAIQRLHTSNTNTNNMNDNASSPKQENSSAILSLAPRPRSVVYMALGMAFHFGGYEFIRNSCLALFTSQEWGFVSPAAFPLANGLVSPFSILLLWAYSRQLDQYGPRIALKHTNLFSVAFIALAALGLQIGHRLALPKPFFQSLIGLTFLYQNSFQYLIYTQQWSFVASVLTPDEGAKYFAVLAGTCSIMCSIAGGVVLPYLLPRIGLVGLLATTCVTLSICTLFCERAYALAQKYHFEPTKRKAKSESSQSSTTNSNEPSSSRLTQAVILFRRVPTLRALLCEVVSFQSLNTLLNIAFVRALQSAWPENDVARSSYSAQLYTAMNLSAAFFQFVLYPLGLNRIEPRWIWRTMPLVPLALTSYLIMVPPTAASAMTWTAAAFFGAKIMDYSIRSVVYPMAYQPLDFESRYVGKEIIGVMGSRMGKSGMSIL
jgi:ATP/ADP translocase